jgi:glutamate-1-semialdehyde 2,1-aminomutase
MGVVLPERGFLEGLRKICDEKGILLIFDEVISGFRAAYGGAQELYQVKVDMFTLFFTEGPVRDYRTAKTSDTKRFAQFFIEMMNEGIYLPPSQFEAWFISLAHTQKDLDKTIEACDTAFRKIT